MPQPDYDPRWNRPDKPGPPRIFYWFIVIGGLCLVALLAYLRQAND